MVRVLAESPGSRAPVVGRVSARGLPLIPAAAPTTSPRLACVPKCISFSVVVGKGPPCVHVIHVCTVDKSIFWPFYCASAAVRVYARDLDGDTRQCQFANLTSAVSQPRSTSNSAIVARR